MESWNKRSSLDWGRASPEKINWRRNFGLMKAVKIGVASVDEESSPVCPGQQGNGFCLNIIGKHITL